jgi:protein-S-isoprenylcysteine O-methyltransferase Ste14
MKNIANWYLVVYLFIYIAISFALPTYRTYKQTGVNPITFGKQDNAHDYIGRVMKLLIACLVLLVVVHAVSKKAYSYFVEIPYLQTNTIYYTGMVLIHVALLWVALAQWQMSTSWRIGIDEQHKTQLVTHGLFAISRNPIFLGILISILGLFLVLPNAFGFTMLVVSYIVIQIQIRLEEAFLTKSFGEQYVAYKRKTRRLI